MPARGGARVVSNRPFWIYAPIPLLWGGVNFLADVPADETGCAESAGIRAKARKFVWRGFACPSVSWVILRACP